MIFNGIFRKCNNKMKKRNVVFPYWASFRYVDYTPRLKYYFIFIFSLKENLLFARELTKLIIQHWEKWQLILKPNIKSLVFDVLCNKIYFRITLSGRGSTSVF